MLERALIPPRLTRHVSTAHTPGRLNPNGVLLARGSRYQLIPTSPTSDAVD
jgi:hypothetical protein